MRKVLSFSFCLMLGLVISQFLPVWFGADYPESNIKFAVDSLLYVCLAFIMINVGRDFEIDKTHWRTYASDYFIAMATAAMPWLLIAAYYVFVLLPSEYWCDLEAWKENLLLSRFAAPTSAGILFTMLAAMHLSKSWIYRKIQVLAIFDDLDTILLMIPLQMLMIGMKWQMGAIIVFVTVALIVGWKWQNTWKVKQTWERILMFAFLVVFFTQGTYLATTYFFDHEGAVHIEVLLPAFILGVLMKTKFESTKMEHRVSTGISLLFMLLVGMSMPQFIGEDLSAAAQGGMVVSKQPMLPWGTIAFHVVMVSLLSNFGKLLPMCFYHDRSLRERLALSVGMFTRGEVGAGVIFIAMSYKLGGPVLVISILTLVLNLILTMGFVLLVKWLAKGCPQEE